MTKTKSTVKPHPRNAVPIVASIPTAQGVPTQTPYAWHTFPLGSKWLARFALILIGLVPFHGFLTVVAAGFGMSYTLARLWTLAVLVAMAVLVSYWLFRDPALRQRLLASYVPRVALVYIVVVCLWAVRGVVFGTVSLHAALLGAFLDARYIVFFLIVYVLTKYQHALERRWLWVVFATSFAVSVFAVLQYTVLPQDILTHVGYSAATIDPVETINNTPSYARVASFLRGPNPLGAYLVLIVSLLAVFWRVWYRRLTWVIALALTLGALFVSFSRSAWIGMVVALGVLVLLRVHTKRHVYWTVGIALVGVCLLASVYALTRHNTAVQIALYHTSDTSTAVTSSNQQRLQAWRVAATDVVHTPFGHGVGSAGPASAHNSKAPVQIAENYYLQIAQETGWIGLVIYLAFIGAMVVTLFRQREDRLSRALLASLVGLLVVNLFVHAWADETIAFIWWGLAGLAIGQRMWRPLKA